MANPSSPPFNELEAMLRKSTEYFAHQVAHPHNAPPQWNDVEWRIGKAVLALQGMSAPLAAILRWQGPNHWQSFLQEQQRQTLLRYQRIDALIAQIDAAARREGIVAVALKGASLYRRGVYRAGERAMGDIDLLVRIRDVSIAKRIVTAAGYSLTIENARHAIFEPDDRKKQFGFGEHIDNPIKIEVHTRIAEALPVATVDITESLFPRDFVAGVNDYASPAALLRHLLLHAAGNLRARALRQIQLHDIALLARQIKTDDWNELLATHDSRGLWWAFPPLMLTARYYPDCIPTSAIAATGRGCPSWLRRTTPQHTLTDVSWSRIRIQAFPGIEWTKSPTELLSFVRTRVFPTRSELAPLKHMADTRSWATEVPWYGQSHLTRIVRWLFTHPPRAQTIYSVSQALNADWQT